MSTSSPATSPTPTALAGAGRRRRRLLPRPLDRLRRRVRGHGPPGGHDVRRGRRGGRRRRIVYLGGLSPEGEELSPHLRSREEVGRILLASGVPTAVLQAAVVLGSGSASFEMLRHLTERLPVMVVPQWVDTRIQPIAIRDVLRYLVGVADLPGRGQPRASTSAVRMS